ncbi:MFS transporter [Nocardioides sp. LHD-245]|uniref:MFS transporter n=1 Tax=Nocardioides sp. LHD-245 TaxID=3051387 RepID=UPI0027E18537|nr:MFS transporter [Nocardioides sp. LHD-245]
MTSTIEPSTTTGVRAVAGVLGTLVAVSVPPFLVGTLAIQMGRTMAFGAGDVATAVAGYYAVSALLSPFSGRFVAWCGPLVALRLAALGSMLGLVGVALAGDAAAVVIALTLIGIPNSLVQPASNQILSGIGPGRVRAIAFGAVQSAIPAATLIAGALLAAVGGTGSWRAAVWAVAVLVAAVQLAIPFGRDAVARAPRLPAGPAVPGTTPVPVGGAPLVAALVGGAFLGSVAATTLPSFLAVTGQHAGVSPQVVGAVQIAGSLTCIVARVLASWTGGRHEGADSLRAVGSMLAGGALGYVLLGTGSGWGFLVGALAAYGLGWGWNGLFNLSVTQARPHSIAAVTGLTQGGVFFGGVCGPLLFAAVAGSGRYGPAWYVIAIAAAASAALIAHARQRWVRSGVVT